MLTLKIPTNTPDPARSRAARRRLRRQHNSAVEEPITIITVDKDGKEEVMNIYSPQGNLLPHERRR
jgi:hypothetical protein